MALSEGTMLTDNLMLERELGRGGMGSVWLATNCSLGSHVAVKVLHPEGGDSPQRRARFEQEARGLAQLDHPNLVKILDFGISSEGEPFIVMELLRGEDLAQRLEREARVPLDVTVRVITQACRALQRAHEAGVVHRDIKPANVFLTDHDGELHVKVLDFGVARFTEGPMEVTKTGVLIGTPAFMSPEQLLKPKTVDHRSDTWALGVLVYSCLTGRLPFEGETIAAIGIAVASTRPPPVTSLVAGVPKAIDFFIERALAFDPNARFQSAKDLGDALTAASRASLVPISAPVPQQHSPQPTTVAIPTPQRIPTPAPLATSPPAPPPPVAVPARPIAPRATGNGPGRIALLAAAGLVALGGVASAAWVIGARGVSAQKNSPKPTASAATAAPIEEKEPTMPPIDLGSLLAGSVSKGGLSALCMPGTECRCSSLTPCDLTCSGKKCSFACVGQHRSVCTFRCPEGGCVAKSSSPSSMYLYCSGKNCTSMCTGEGTCMTMECPDCPMKCTDPTKCSAH